MKKIWNITAIIALCIISSIRLHAQRQILKLDLNYNYSFPMGSFKNNIISDASPRGFSGELMYDIHNKWAAGLAFGFQDYYQKYPRAIYQTGDHEVTSAVLSNSVQTMPVLAKGIFSPFGGTKSSIQPYLSVTAGLGIVDFRQYLGEFGGTTNGAGFMAQGGAGIRILFGKFNSSGFKIGADYNYIGYNKNDFGNLSSLDVHAGIFFPLK
jgi:hypothetical protein